MLGKFLAMCKYFFPKLEALAFAEVQMRSGTKIALEELTTRANIHSVERVGKQL